MNPTQGPPNGVRLFALAAFVGAGALVASGPFEPHRGPQQEQHLGRHTFEVRPGMLVDMQPPRRYDHPYFQGENKVISGVDCSRPSMRHDLFELLFLFGIQEIAEGSLGRQRIVAAIMNDSGTEILRTELRPSGERKSLRECLFLIERSDKGILFKVVNADGLPLAKFKWFKSLEGKKMLESVFIEEIRNQYSENEGPFRQFYRTKAGSDPDAIRRLYAWVSLDNGRVTHVNTADALDTEELPGLRVEFGVSVYGGNAHIWCMDRGLLSGMLTLHQHYFHDQIWIRNVFSALEESDWWEGVVPGEEGVPGGNADESGSDVMLLA